MSGFGLDDLWTVLWVSVFVLDDVSLVVGWCHFIVLLIALVDFVCAVIVFGEW